MPTFYDQKKRIYSEINRIIELFKRRDECIDHDKFVDEIRIAFGVGDRMILDYFELLQRKGIIKIEYENTEFVEDKETHKVSVKPNMNSRLLIVPLVAQIHLTDHPIDDKNVS